MLLEAIFLGGAAIWAAAEGYNKFKHKAASPQLSAPATAKSEVAQLVIEALRERTDWSHYRSLGLTNRSLGIQLRVDPDYMTPRHRVKLKIVNDESGQFEEVAGISNDDYKLLEKEFLAYESRAEDTRQREIARTLAKRVLGSPPTSGSVLGGRGVPSLPASAEVDQDRGPAPLPAGMLTYDPRSGQVVQIGDSSTGVVMDTRLRERYGLASQIHSDLAVSAGLVWDVNKMCYVTRDPYFRGSYHEYKGKAVVYVPPSGED